MNNYYSFWSQVKLRPYINFLKLINFYKFHKFEKTIFISGSPRGGTTWLEEILQNSINTLYVHEPFFIGRIKQFEKLGFNWNQFIPKIYNNKETVKFFNKLLSGQKLNLALLEKNLHPFNLHNADYILIKSVRSGLLLPWLTKLFNLKVKPIHIVRHPCAVISSQLQHPSWSYLNKLDFPFKYKTSNTLFNEFWGIIEEALPTINSKEELLAVNWCLDQYPVFCNKNSINWITVSYEDMVLRGTTLIEEIMYKSGLDIGVERNTMIKPSSSTEINNPKLNGEKQIEKWQKKLNPTQIRSIERIMNIFSIQYYDTSKTRPNSKLLESNQNYSELFNRCQNLFM